jgi:hypothetical protein
MVNRMKKLDRISSGIAGAAQNLLGKQVSRAISGTAANQIKMAGMVPAFKKGGRVKKTGLAKVHKGEVVLTASSAKTLKRLLNK